MTRWVEGILARYGQEVTVERDGTAEAVRADSRCRMAD